MENYVENVELINRITWTELYNEKYTDLLLTFWTQQNASKQFSAFLVSAGQFPSFILTELYKRFAARVAETANADVKGALLLLIPEWAHMFTNDVHDPADKLSDYVDMMLRPAIEAAIFSRPREEKDSIFGIAPKIPMIYLPQLDGEGCKEMEARRAQLKSADAATIFPFLNAEMSQPRRGWFTARRAMETAYLVLARDATGEMAERLKAVAFTPELQMKIVRIRYGILCHVGWQAVTALCLQRVAREVPTAPIEDLLCFEAARFAALCKAKSAQFNEAFYGPAAAAAGAGAEWREKIMQGPAKFEKLCWSCWKPNASSRCARCGLLRYCDATCQRNHWGAHKGACEKRAPFSFLIFDEIALDHGSPTFRYPLIHVPPEEALEHILRWPTDVDVVIDAIGQIGYGRDLRVDLQLQALPILCSISAANPTGHTLHGQVCRVLQNLAEAGHAEAVRAAGGVAVALRALGSESSMNGYDTLNKLGVTSLSLAEWDFMVNGVRFMASVTWYNPMVDVQRMMNAAVAAEGLPAQWVASMPILLDAMDPVSKLGDSEGAIFETLHLFEQFAEKAESLSDAFTAQPLWVNRTCRLAVVCKPRSQRVLATALTFLKTVVDKASTTSLEALPSQSAVVELLQLTGQKLVKAQGDEGALRWLAINAALCRNRETCTRMEGTGLATVCEECLDAETPIPIATVALFLMQLHQEHAHPARDTWRQKHGTLIVNCLSRYSAEPAALAAACGALRTYLNNTHSSHRIGKRAKELLVAIIHKHMHDEDVAVLSEANRALHSLIYNDDEDELWDESINELPWQIAAAHPTSAQIAYSVLDSMQEKCINFVEGPNPQEWTKAKLILSYIPLLRASEHMEGVALAYELFMLATSMRGDNTSAVKEPNIMYLGLFDLGYIDISLALLEPKWGGESKVYLSRLVAHFLTFACLYPDSRKRMMDTLLERARTVPWVMESLLACGHYEVDSMGEYPSMVGHAGGKYTEISYVISGMFDEYKPAGFESRSPDDDGLPPDFAVTE